MHFAAVEETVSRSHASGRGARRADLYAALTQTSLASRYVSWKGSSGKAYVISVYASRDCPAFCDAIVLAVARDGQGDRRLLSAFDTGAFPEPVLARVQHDLGRRGGLEFHVHLLAREASERRAALTDLGTVSG